MPRTEWFNDWLDDNFPEEDVEEVDEVIKRRMPQFVGVYIAIGWTIIQFTDWLTQRYQYSPHLVDLALAIIISMIPHRCNMQFLVMIMCYISKLF